MFKAIILFSILLLIFISSSQANRGTEILALAACRTKSKAEHFITNHCVLENCQKFCHEKDYFSGWCVGFSTHLTKWCNCCGKGIKSYREFYTKPTQKLSEEAILQKQKKFALAAKKNFEDLKFNRSNFQ